MARTKSMLVALVVVGVAVWSGSCEVLVKSPFNLAKELCPDRKPLEDKFLNMPGQFTSREVTGQIILPTYVNDTAVLQVCNSDAKLTEAQEFIRRKFIINVFDQTSNAPCTLLDQVLALQRLGAYAILLVNSANETLSKFELNNRQIEFDYNVQVPVILLNNTEGFKIIEYLKSDPLSNRVSSRIIFEHIIQRSVPTVEYWMEPLQLEAYVFLREFINYYVFIEDRIDVKIRFPVDKYQQCKANGPKCTDCISNNKYCMTPIRVGFQVYSGSDQLYEVLRQLCVMKLYGMNGWWQYANSFSWSDCLFGEGSVSDIEQCSLSAMSQEDIDTSSVAQCVQDSYSSSTGQNTLLDEHQWQTQRERVSTTPVLFVNEEEYEHSLDDPAEAFVFICEGFMKETRPKECEDVENLFEIDESDEPDAEDVAAEKWRSTKNYFIALLVIALVVLAVGVYLLRRRIRLKMKKEVSLQVSTAISQYYMLAERERQNTASGVQ